MFIPTPLIGKLCHYDVTIKEGISYRRFLEY